MVMTPSQQKEPTPSPRSPRPVDPEPFPYRQPFEEHVFVAPESGARAASRLSRRRRRRGAASWPPCNTARAAAFRGGVDGVVHHGAARRAPRRHLRRSSKALTKKSRNGYGVVTSQLSTAFIGQRSRAENPHTRAFAAAAAEQQTKDIHYPSRRSCHLQSGYPGTIVKLDPSRAAASLSFARLPIEPRGRGRDRGAGSAAYPRGSRGVAASPPRAAPASCFFPVSIEPLDGGAAASPAPIVRRVANRHESPPVPLDLSGLRTGRGTAAAATWIFGGGARQRPVASRRYPFKTPPPPDPYATEGIGRGADFAPTSFRDTMPAAAAECQAAYKTATTARRANSDKAHACHISWSD